MGVLKRRPTVRRRIRRSAVGIGLAASVIGPAVGHAQPARKPDAGYMQPARKSDAGTVRSRDPASSRVSAAREQTIERNHKIIQETLTGMKNVQSSLHSLFSGFHAPLGIVGEVRFFFSTQAARQFLTLPRYAQARQRVLNKIKKLKPINFSDVADTFRYNQRVFAILEGEMKLAGIPLEAEHLHGFEILPLTE